MSEFRTLLPATAPVVLVTVPCPRCGALVLVTGHDPERVTTQHSPRGAGHRSLHLCPPTHGGHWVMEDNVMFDTPRDTPAARAQFAAWGIPWPDDVDRFRCTCRTPVTRHETRSAGDIYSVFTNDDGTVHSCQWTR
jgi:hypothetical protein